MTESGGEAVRLELETIHDYKGEYRVSFQLKAVSGIFKAELSTSDYEKAREHARSVAETLGDKVTSVSVDLEKTEWIWSSLDDLP